MTKTRIKQPPPDRGKEQVRKRGEKNERNKKNHHLEGCLKSFKA
jgi:hypothetical protein